MKYCIDFLSYVEDGKVFVYVDYALHHLKVYYRPERTWDDHLGNTPCGYYVNAPLPSGKRKRVYLCRYKQYINAE